MEKSFKWKLSNSGKPKSGNRYGNPEPSPKIIDYDFCFAIALQSKIQNLKLREGAEARRELP
ncbi:hypothetical protein BV378_22500 [Nostoc sp. RF31YmG]|nr:hypothetical protein BV378_22500 [Nostoc sp. RF31YmG]OUL28855.1 hypothetical protein BV375_17215 [Nostoc sp. 106C]